MKLGVDQPDQEAHLKPFGDSGKEKPEKNNVDEKPEQNGEKPEQGVQSVKKQEQDNKNILDEQVPTPPK